MGTCFSVGYWSISAKLFPLESLHSHCLTYAKYIVNIGRRLLKIIMSPEVVYLFQVSFAHVELQGIVTLYVTICGGYIVGLAKSKRL